MGGHQDSRNCPFPRHREPVTFSSYSFLPLPFIPCSFIHSFISWQLGATESVSPAASNLSLTTATKTPFMGGNTEVLAAHLSPLSRHISPGATCLRASAGLHPREGAGGAEGPSTRSLASGCLFFHKGSQCPPHPGSKRGRGKLLATSQSPVPWYAGHPSQGAPRDLSASCPSSL